MKVITPHPRFQAFVANIRHRKGAKAMGKEPTEPLFIDFDGDWIVFLIGFMMIDEDEPKTQVIDI